MADYGLGSLPFEAYGFASALKTPVHVFTEVDSALFMLSGHNPFTEVYVYDEAGDATPNKGVNERGEPVVNDLVRKVNRNSNPGEGRTRCRVPKVYMPSESRQKRMWC